MSSTTRDKTLPFALLLACQGTIGDPSGELVDDPIDRPDVCIGEVGPTIAPTQGVGEIKVPDFNEDPSDDDLSDEASEKPLGIEEFKQKVENNRKQESKKKNKKGGQGGRK